MLEWPVHVHLVRHLRPPEVDALEAAFPGPLLLGSSTSGDIWVGLTQTGSTLEEAAEAALERVQRHVAPGVVTRAGHADELMHDRQVLLWARATISALDRWEGALAYVVAAQLPAETDEGWRIWDCQIERHFALVAANNLRRAVRVAAGRFPSMRAELADAIWVLRDVSEHWDEQWPTFYRHDGERRRAGARFEQTHPGTNPFVFESWTHASGPMLGPDFPSSDLRAFAAMIEAAVVEARPDFTRFVGPTRGPSWEKDERGEFRPAISDLL